MGHKSFRITWLHVVYHSVSGIAIALLIWYTGLLSGIEGKTFDLRANLFSQKAASTDSIVLVLVDQESIDWVSENMGIGWPWPRELFGAIIVNCLRRDAEAVGFDVMFTEYSNFCVHDDLKLQSAIVQMAYFALGSVFLSQEFGQSTRWPDNIPKPKYNLEVSDDAQPMIPSYSKATFPIPELAQEGVVLSNIQHQPDNDGIFRKIHPFVQFDSNLLPSLGLGVYLSAHPDAEISIQNGSVEINGMPIPLDKEGKAILNYRGPSGTFTSLSAASIIRNECQLINGEISTDTIQDDFAGKYVLFGFTAPGLFDLRPSPTDGVFSGVEINATLLDNFLAGDFIQPAHPWFTIFSVVLLTVLSTTLLSYFTTQSTQIILSFFLTLLPVGIAFLFYRMGMDFILIPVETAVLTGIAVSIAQRYFIVGRQEKFIRHSFKHYLSPVVIDQLLVNPDRLQLGGERKELTLFFSDLEGFTTISEGLEPEDLTQLLNEYLTAMTDIILDEKGTVDKFEGDAIIAFWNAPLDIANHAERAVRAALRCQEKLARLQPVFMKKYNKNLFMRIGINTGFAVAGNMGSSTRFDYTVLGDAVNLAARLEGANKCFGTYTMISQATKKQLGSNFFCRELATLRVVGRSEPVTVFEPLTTDTRFDRSTYESFDRGLKYYYAGRLQDALNSFQESAAEDPVSRYYFSQCQKFLSENQENWNCVLDLDSK